jgi:hypothetical protein
MAFKSKRKGNLRVGTCVVENGARLWKAPGTAGSRKAASACAGRASSQKRERGQGEHKKGVAVEN